MTVINCLGGCGLFVGRCHVLRLIAWLIDWLVFYVIWIPCFVTYGLLFSTPRTSLLSLHTLGLNWESMKVLLLKQLRYNIATAIEQTPKTSRSTPYHDPIYTVVYGHMGMKLLTCEFTFTGYARTLDTSSASRFSINGWRKIDTHSFPVLVIQQPQNREAG